MHQIVPSRRIPVALRAWLVLDLILVLLPPLHWWAGMPETVLGVPRVLAYLFGTGFVLALSAVAVHHHLAGAAEEVR
jgi:hypothetical protein